jgi:hypothetical protein
MTAARWAACSLGFVMAAASVVGACGDAGPRGTAITGGGGVGDGDGGGAERLTEASTSEGGVAITPRPDLCDGLMLGGNPIAETSLAGGPPPPLGGKVIPGTYDLEELDVYAAARAGDGGGDSTPVPPPTGRVAQATIVVTEFAVRTIEAHGSSMDAGLPPETARAVLYRVDGTSLVVTAVCPTTEQPRSVPFSAVGGGLALFVDDTHRELYVRR